MVIWRYGLIMGEKQGADVISYFVSQSIVRNHSVTPRRGMEGKSPQDKKKVLLDSLKSHEQGSVVGGGRSKE